MRKVVRKCGLGRDSVASVMIALTPLYPAVVSVLSTPAKVVRNAGRNFNPVAKLAYVVTAICQRLPAKRDANYI